MIHEPLQKNIDNAAKLVGKTWPLYAFVTSNPLSGYEDIPFEKAVRRVEKHMGARVFPGASLYRQAWEQKEIDENELLTLLEENGMSESPEWYLRQMESQKTVMEKNINHDLDRIMAKWLAAFMDEGLAEWEMPYKNEGFYNAWRKLAIYDGELGINSRKDLPKSGSDALAEILKEYPEKEHISIFTYHLAALPGWTGYIKYRKEANSFWHMEYPITLEDYLAVRLWIAKHIKAEMLPKTDKTEILPISNLQLIWLKAWEKSWQNRLVNSLTQKSMTLEASENEGPVPDAQMVLCIDTRSEAIRRHIESKGNYETYGYAGFFGIAMDYQNLSDGLIRKSCPPIVSSTYKVVEILQKGNLEKLSKYKRKNEVLKFRQYFLKRMKNMLPSAFGYVEGSGAHYGISLLLRTLLPGYFHRLNGKNTPSHENICEPEIDTANSKEDLIVGIPLNEKTALVKSAFDLTGLKHFAPLVFFVGHGSHSTNNPFGSSLDCGACAASPGRHNARMLAKLANLPEVRIALEDNFDLKIPADTFFIGAEHNTTTDEIVVFASKVPDSHQERLQKVRTDLFKAQRTATQERLGVVKDSVAMARKKALDWAETRPEWGLAKNAGFIIAPRALTKNRNLDGQCFLHSYNWEMDKNGSALEGILQGPMVVTQWINNHYYFSTVDTEKFGGGSKITQNVTGKFGVVQGNGGDLKMGLPLQSVKESDEKMYHRPLRLSVFIQAPVAWIEEILLRNENLKSLLDNEWIYLLVMDPTEENRITRYQKDMKWDRSVGRTGSSKDFIDKVPAEDLNELSMV